MNLTEEDMDAGLEERRVLFSCNPPSPAASPLFPLIFTSGTT